MKASEFLVRVGKNFGNETMERCRAEIGDAEELTYEIARRALGKSLESQSTHLADFVCGSRATLAVLDPDAFN